jgi:hypothetical protein
VKKVALLVTLASGACVVSAQDAVGSLQGVSGAVSISGKNVVSRVSSGTPVTEGASILVSSSGKATLVLNNGCSVTLGANQHLNVSANMSCAQVSASVKHLFPAYQVAQAPIGNSIIRPPVMPMSNINPPPVNPYIPLATFGVGWIAANNSTNSNTPVSGQ